MQEELHVGLHSMLKLLKVDGMAVIFVTICHYFLVDIKFETHLGMKSKLGENLHCKALYPLPPSIFTDVFSPAISYVRHDQETFHLNEGKPTLYTHSLK